jgi:glycine/D-amino acid oxidase-like deaminating enzyme
VERVRDVLPSEHYFSAAHFPGAFHIHPLNYIIGLAAAAEAAGARIFEDTLAISIDPAGIRKRIQTPSAMIRAGHVILSGNVHLGSLMPRLAATLIPITTYILVTEPLGTALHDVIRYRGAISDGERADHHYRIVGGDRLQWSGRMTTSEVDPLRFARSLITSLGRVFPSLAGVKVANIWSGTFGRPLHRMPQIGEIQRGVWVASGFSGHGINNTAMAGELIARGLVDNDETWRLFAPYELVWAGGKAGRIIAKTLYTGSQPVQALREGLARYVAGARKRRAAAKSKNPAPAADRDGSDAGAPAA